MVRLHFGDVLQSQQQQRHAPNDLNPNIALGCALRMVVFVYCSVRNLSWSCGKLAQSMVKVGKIGTSRLVLKSPVVLLERVIEFHFVIHNICRLV